MKEKENRIVDLITRALRGRLNDAEMEELEAWKAESDTNRAFADQFNEENLAAWLKEREEVDVEKGFMRFKKATGLDQPVVVPMYRKQIWRMVAAASVIGILAVSSYLYIGGSRDQKKTDKALVAQQDVMPGGNKAVLHLGNDSTVILDGGDKGRIAQEGEAEIIQEKDGELTYAKIADARDLPSPGLVYHTLVTPRGGQYMLMLADGTKVWLNAASSLRYPAMFKGQERKVEITGEAYFEVAKNPRMPFRVQFNGAEVEVLGTHFNINTYESQSATTLLEGAVKVSNRRSSGQTAILKPGQQAVLAGDAQLTVRSAVDTDEVMAWKLGYFNFDDVSLPVIMNEIARWYDCEVVYEKETQIHFSFRMRRDIPVSMLLEVLEKTGAVKFEIDGAHKTIRVLKE